MSNGSGSGSPPGENPAKAKSIEGVRAVIFDMDGTLVNSIYDWPTIRHDLGVDGGSIIEELDKLSEPERMAKLTKLEAIETAATLEASIHNGVSDLLLFLQQRGLATALVTNNNRANTEWLLDRFSLAFAVVMTRDSGLWKPSGAPIAEAARRLGVPPDQCLGVGDSHYDILAARDAGLKAVCMLHDGAVKHNGDADLSFVNIPRFLQYLRVALG